MLKLKIEQSLLVYRMDRATPTQKANGIPELRHPPPHGQTQKVFSTAAKSPHATNVDKMRPASVINNSVSCMDVFPKIKHLHTY